MTTAEPAIRETITRAWATLEIKRSQKPEGDQREITGVASTPSTDRMGDIVEPLGLDFENPLPLLWQHKHDAPIGLAYLNKPTEDGVTFKAQLATISEDGDLKRRIDDAWQAIKHGLVRGISIGFKTLESSFMKNSGGIRFEKALVVELSLVTVPANAEASISTIKQFDAAPQRDARKLPDEGKKPETRKAAKMPTTVSEQITNMTAQRKTDADRMAAIMQKAADENRTLDEAEKTEYDGLETKIANISDHLARLEKLDAQNRMIMVPVAGATPADASKSRDPGNGGGGGGIIQMPTRVVVAAPKVEPGTAFIRFGMVMAAAKGIRLEAMDIVRRNAGYFQSTPEVEMLLREDVPWMTRAAQPAGTTYDSAWAGPLVVAQNVTSEFAEFLRPQTIIGRINGFRRVPFNVQIPRATAGTTAGWVGEAAPKPLTAMAFDTITMRWAKAAAIVVLTEELVRFSNPSAEAIVRADLARGIVQFLDRQFVDPSVTAVTNVSPASVTNGVTAIVPSGSNMAAFRADTAALLATFYAAGISTAGGHWIMTQQQAQKLSVAQNSLGQQIFPTITPEGGTLMGYPVVASENIPSTTGSPSEGFPIIFIVPSEVLLADDGQVTVDASREATLQMDTTPDSPPTGSTNMASLWQLNMLGLRAERWITWLKRRAGAVGYISAAKYTE